MNCIKKCYRFKFFKMIIEIEDNNIEEAKNNVEFVRKESKI